MQISKRDALESRFAGRIGALSQRHAAELRRLLGNPPDPSRVPVEFWLRVQREQEEEMTALMLLIFLASADEHAVAAGVTIDAGLVQRMETQGVNYAQRRAAEVASGYVQHSRDMLNTAAEEWRGRTGETPLSGVDTEPVLDRIFGDRRMGGVAANETTQAQFSGSDNVIRATIGVQETDTWFTRSDRHVCQICAPLHREPRSVWSRQFPDGPPAHPVCRCWIEYAFEKDKPRTKGGNR